MTPNIYQVLLPPAAFVFLMIWWWAGIAVVVAYAVAAWSEPRRFRGWARRLKVTRSVRSEISTEAGDPLALTGFLVDGLIASAFGVGIGLLIDTIGGRLG